MLLKIELSLMIKFLPNIITVFRIILVPFFVYFLISDIYHGKLIALFIFTIATLSDMIDGKLARKYNIITKFGTFMDPLADKINYNFSELITFINDYSIIYILMLITTLFTAITGFDYFVKNHKMIKLIILKK